MDPRELEKAAHLPFEESQTSRQAGERYADDGKGTPMTKVEDEAVLREEGEHALDVLAREGARRMIAAALEVEVEDYLARHRALRDEPGRAEVVRNGRGRDRKVTIGWGTVTLQAPRVERQARDRRRAKALRQPDPPAVLERSRNVSDRIDVRDGEVAATGDEGSGVTSCWARDGLQALAPRGAELAGPRRAHVAAGGERASAASTGSSERDDLDEVASDPTTSRETKAPSVGRTKSTKSGE
ncbi:MAG: hypothetical protein H6720_15265 [Sandaracinus sp.]|nr:hypothetical protein [Sandaracinus sp.]